MIFMDTFIVFEDNYAIVTYKWIQYTVHVDDLGKLVFDNCIADEDYDPNAIS